MGLASGLLGSVTAVAQTPRVTRPPRLQRFVEAMRPEGAPDTDASVVMVLTVSETGAVTDAQVTRSDNPLLDAAALAAARQFVFEPAEVEGRPTAVRLSYRYRFVHRVVAPPPAPTPAPAPPVLEPEAPPVARPTAPVRAAPVRRGRRADEEEEGSVVVRGTGARRSVASTEVSAEQARRVPGTQGDVLRVVESLPGVARSTAGAGQLVVWGAAPEETRIVVDGVPIPRLYHDGGLRSVLASDFVQSVELAPGGYGAAFGRGLGGLVSITTRPLTETGVHGAVNADLYDVGASTRANLGRGVRVALAARRSHLHSLLDAFAETPPAALFPVPQYWDGVARVSYQPSSRERVELTVLGSHDTTTRATASPDPQAATRETRSLDFTRVWTRYQRSLVDGATVQLTPWVGTEHRRTDVVVGNVPVRLDHDAWQAGLRASWRRRVVPRLLLEVGLDLELRSSTLQRDGATASPPREGDRRTFGQPPPDQVNADRWSVTTLGVAPYLEGDLSLAGGRVHIIPGLRLDPTVRSVSRRSPADGDIHALGLFAQDFSVEPRLALRAQVASRVTLRSAVGWYRQQPNPEDLSAAFSTPTLASARAFHALVGAAVVPVRGLTVEVTGFTAPRQNLAVRSGIAAPLLAQALADNGTGNAYGAQALVRLEPTHGVFGWISYAITRSERTDQPGGTARRFDFDQTHVLSAVVGWEIGRGWEVGTRARYASGYPRTPVVDAYYDARLDRTQPLFGALNSTSLPDFFQLDLRVAKRFRLSTRASLEVSLDVQNVTNRRNPEEIVWSADYRSQGYITGLPLLPVLGVRCVY